MKLTVTLDTTIATDAAILAGILSHLDGDLGFVAGPPLTDEEEVEVEAEVDEEAAKKARKAAQGKARREAKKAAAAAAAAAEAETDELALEDDDTGVEDEVELEPVPKKPAKKGKAKKATEADLKKAVKTAIERDGIESVRAAFAEFKGKGGAPCAKMSDVKPGDLAAVIAKLEEGS